MFQQQRFAGQSNVVNNNTVPDSQRSSLQSDVTSQKQQQPTSSAAPSPGAGELVKKRPESQMHTNANNGYGGYGLHMSQSYMTQQQNLTAEDIFGDCGCGGVVPDFENGRSAMSCIGGGSELDESSSELEFISSQVPSGKVSFTPKRCSTPLKSMDMNVPSPSFFHENAVPLVNYASSFGSRPSSSASQTLSAFAPQKALFQQHRRLPAYSGQPSYPVQRDTFVRVPDLLNISTNSMGSFGSPTRSAGTIGSQSPVSLLDSPEKQHDHWTLGAGTLDAFGGRGTGCCVPMGLGGVGKGGYMSDGSTGSHNGYARSIVGSGMDHRMPLDRWPAKDPVELQAQAYRLAASICVPNVVWSGILPARNCKGSAYSCKVFLGGVPWDITEPNLNAAFGKFGPLKVEWPSSHEHANRNSKGYLYIVFDNERSVRALLMACTQDFSNGNRNYYYKVCSNRLRRKDVQIIPWQLADSTYVRNGCMSALGTKTVFVGSLHGMLNAEGLARIMDDLFGGVVAANVDTDKHKYPIGSGRVVFNCTHSYIKAIRAAFVELRTQKFSKKIQIDPFLEDSMCSICQAVMGPFFCRDMECFQYFCGTCWQWQHSVDSLKHHSPMMRNPRVHDVDY